MANLYRMRVQWAGGSVVGPGLTTFFFDPLSLSMQASVEAFFQGIKAEVPAGTQWTIPGSGDVLDDATGTLVGTWSEGIDKQVNATGIGTFALGVGCRIVWSTGAIRGGRRVRGSTYVVPLRVGAYDSEGTITNTTLTALRNAADGLLMSPNVSLQVWSRPRPGLIGAAVPVSSSSVPDAISTLRSRRT